MSSFTEPMLSGTAFFVEDFDVPLVPKSPVENVKLELYTKDELDAGRSQAWNEGFVAGRDEERSVRGGDIERTLQSIVQEVKDLRGTLLSSNELLVEELAKFVISMFQSMLPTLSERYGAAEIAAVAAEILPTLARDQKIRVQVSPCRLDVLDAIIAEYDTEFRENIHLVSSEKLGPSDIVVRWDRGEAVRDMSEIWRNALAILATLDLQQTSKSEQLSSGENFDVE